MKKFTLSLLGIGLLSGVLFAHGGKNDNMKKEKEQKMNNHMGDHMHNGKMMNHGNHNGMTDKELSMMKSKKKNNNHMN